MGKIYRIVLNSDISPTTFVSSRQFFYDWSKLEQGSYKCSFTFISGKPTTSPNFIYVVNISLDLGQSNVYFPRPTNTRADLGPPNYIGSLTHNNIDYDALDPYADSAYLFATLETNPPFYLQQRPTNNIFTVNMQTNTSPIFGFNSSLVGKYTLTLYLEKMD